MIVRAADLYDGINMLDNKKACGMDCIAAGNLFTCSCLTTLLAICFNGVVGCGPLPKAIMCALFMRELKDNVIGQDCVYNTGKFYWLSLAG